MSLSSDIAPHLPYLRRYARALTGSQAQGDAIVRATLEALIAEPGRFRRNVDARLELYGIFHATWIEGMATHAATEEDTSSYEIVARERLSVLTPRSRQALLLTAMEGFTREDSAHLLGVPATEVDALVREALDEVSRQTATRVLIIEDEPIIAMDLEALVRDMGHSVTGVAITHEEAVSMAAAMAPGLILADIQLADNSSGIDAVRDILTQFSVPVIFITAFPERLLTGTRPEPAFMITKPFQRSTVAAAISQALFFRAAARFSS